MRHDAVAAAILEHLRRLGAHRRTTLALHSPLLDGTIDSLALTSLIAFVERRYDIGVRHEDVTAANFGSPAALSAFIESRLRESPAAGSQG